MKKQGPITKKEYNYYLAIINVTIIVILLVIGLLVEHRIQRETRSDDAGIEYERHYMMVSADINNAFTEKVYDFAKQAGDESGVYVELVGQNLSEDYKLQELLEIAVASKPDGIIVESDNTSKTNELIERATENGIPVITYLNDGAYTARKSYIGTSYYNLGKAYGEEILRVSPAHRVSVLVLVKGSMSNAGRDSLVTGIVDMIQGAEDEVTVNINLQPIDTSSVFAVQESVHNFLSDEIKEKCIICVDELITDYVYQDVVDYNRVGEINVIGGGVSESIIEAIETGVLSSSICVDMEQMGTQCVNALNEYLDTGYISNYTYVDTVRVSKDNTDWARNILQKNDTQEE